MTEDEGRRLMKRGGRRERAVDLVPVLEPGVRAPEAGGLGCGLINH